MIFYLRICGYGFCLLICVERPDLNYCYSLFDLSLHLGEKFSDRKSILSWTIKKKG